MKIVDFIVTTRDRFSEAFLKSKESEFAEFERHETDKNRVAELFRLHSDRLSNLKLLHAALADHLKFFKDADLPSSFYNHLQNSYADIGLVQSTAEALLPAFFLKNIGDEILEISAREIAGLEEKLSIFKKANNALLKELRLI